MTKDKDVFPLLSILSHVALQQKKDVRMLRFIQEVNTTTRSCALWDLEEETDYIVHVQSIGMSGTSPLSEPLRFRTPKEAETQASKSKGRVAQRQKYTNMNACSVFQHKMPFQDTECRGDLILSKPIKINGQTKHEMKFHNRVLLKPAPLTTTRE